MKEFDQSISSDIDCSELQDKLNDIQHGLVVVLCERSEDVEALHGILEDGIRKTDKLITNDPNSSNTDFHRNDLGKLDNFEQTNFYQFSIGNTFNMWRYCSKFYNFSSVVDLILDASEDSDSEEGEESEESEGECKSILLTLRSLFNITCEHAFLINTPEEVLVTRRFGIVTNEFVRVPSGITIEIVVLDAVSHELKRRKFRIGLESHVEDISKELHRRDGENTSHIYINNKISQLQDDDRVADVFQRGEILTGLAVGQDQPRNKDSPAAGDILVMVERSQDKSIFIPVDRTGTFKFKPTEFYPTIAVFKKQLADEGREIGAEDLYVGHKYEIPQDDALLSFKIENERVYSAREEGANSEIRKIGEQRTKLESAFQKPLGRVIPFQFENLGEDVYVINGRKTDFEATLVARGERAEVSLRPDHRTIHEFCLTSAETVSRDSQGLREFSAAVFPLPQHLQGGVLTITTEGKVILTTGEGEGEDRNVPAKTTDGGEPVRKTFREAEKKSAEEEEKEWLKWLLPNISSG